jgi:hypothetical protein
MRLSSIASPFNVSDWLMPSTWNLLYWESKWMPPGVFTENAQEIRVGEYICRAIALQKTRGTGPVSSTRQDEDEGGGRRRIPAWVRRLFL